MPGTNIQKLELLVKHLESQVESRNEQIATLNAYIAKASKETQTMIDACRNFCMKILEMEIADGSISSAELQALSLQDLTQKAISEYDKRQVKNRELFDVFAKRLEEKNNVINGLQSQVSQLQVRLAQNVASVGDDRLPEPKDETPSLQRQTAYLIDTDKSDISDIQPAINKTNDVTENSESVISFSESVIREASHVKTAKKSSSPMMIDYKAYKNQMTNLMWQIIELMGKEGLCEFAEIRMRCFEGDTNQTVKLSAVNSALNALKSMKAISQGIKINTGIRWFYTYELEELGTRMYIDKFKKPPVESEIQRLIREHDNINHGYYIKEAKGVLQEKYDYQSISTSRKANYIKLPNHKASIPDIICAGKNKVDYYEVECGNHPQNEFNDKCNKLKMVSPELHFIVPDVKTLNKRLIPQIQSWIRSVGGPAALKQSNVVVYLTTLKKLQDKEWFAIFDMSSDEPKLLNKEE